jgi:hypothetical protein
MKNIRRHRKRVQPLRRPGARGLCAPGLYDYHVTTAYHLPPGTIRFRVLS